MTKQCAGGYYWDEAFSPLIMNLATTQVTELSKENEIPKIIWMFWSQGYEQAPNTVKKCYESWQKYNQHWEIRFLDESTLAQYLPNLAKICEKNNKFLQSRRALYSDIIRLNLLKEYGGVWVDSTCFCCMPLDQWLDQYDGNGFVVFSGMSRNRMVDTWFIAASSSSYLLQRWCEEFNNFFQDYVLYECYWHEFYSHYNKLIENQGFKSLKIFELKLKNKLRELLFKVTNKNTFFPIALITNPLVRLKYVPYFVCHYTFAKIVFFDYKCREIWNDTPKINGRMATTIVGTRFFDIPADPNIKEHIDQRKSPVYKLSYKFDKKQPEIKNIEETTLYYLFASHLKDKD